MRPKASKRREGIPSSRSKLQDGDWWKVNQVKNLDALSLSLSDDLQPFSLCEEGDWSAIDSQVFAAKALRRSFLKKYEWELNEKANAAALEKFLKVNDDCRSWSLDRSTISDIEDIALNEVKSILYKSLNRDPLDPLFSCFEKVLEHAKVGPGASLGANGTGFYSKLFSSQLTCTSPGLYHAYSNYIDNFPTWSDAESIRYDQFGGCDIVKGNKLCFVPKNVDVSRVICVEPSLNMYYQLGVKHLLEREIVRSFGIDFSVQQSRNRDLAQLASMFDDHWVTIDLSSASDSMSLKMLQQFLPRDIFSFLVLLRSPEMTLPNGSQLELEMISTMGNGYTFPLQTLLFLSVVAAAHRVLNVPFERPRGLSLGNFGVYGDDIICRVEVSDLVIRLLALLGFSVNDSKSYFKGPFRESCGGDFFRGHPVRGFYLKSLRTTQDAYVAINALNRWTAITGIFLARTVRLLLCWISKRCRVIGILRVPLAENDDAGLKVPRSMIRKLVVDKNVQSIQYRRFVQRPLQIRFTEEGTVKHPLGSHKDPSRGIIYNPSGLLISFVSGNISGSGEGVRQDFPHYRTELRVTPYWDYLGNMASVALAGARLQLGTAVLANTGLN